MELNKWYKLDAQMEDEFVRLAPKINREILKVIKDRPFEVLEFEPGDNEGIYLIRFEEGDPIKRLEVLPQFTEANWSSSWFYKDEFKLFEEVEMVKAAPIEDYIIHVSGLEPTEYGGGTGFMVGTSSAPQRFTLDAAKEHAKFVLDKEGPKARVDIFRLETTAQVVSEIKFS